MTKFITLDFLSRGKQLLIDTKGFTHILSNGVVTVLKNDKEITSYIPIGYKGRYYVTQKKLQ